MPKVAESKITSNRNTVVPAPIAMALQLAVGDMIEWHIENGNVTIRKKAKHGQRG